MDVNFKYGMNSYIAERAPEKFGRENQEDFVSWMIRAQHETREEIRRAPKQESVLIELFYSVIDKLARARKEIAQRHQNPEANSFGSRRDLDREFTARNSETIFSKNGHDYGEYTPKILNRLAQDLRHLDIQEAGNVIKERITNDQFEDLSSSFEVKVFEIHHMISYQVFAFLHYPEGFPIDMLEMNRNNLNDIEIEQLREADKEIKKQFPDLYERKKVTDIFNRILNFKSIFNKGENGEIEPKSLFALGKMKLQVGEEMVDSTMWLTWLHRDEHGTHPVDHMLDRSSVGVVHMDKYLIDETLKKIADLFAKAICAGRENCADLQKNIGLMRYYMAHCMPWGRGSAAIAEALEGAVYNACGYQVLHNPKMLVDLEALSTPQISVFMENYPNMVKLLPIVELPPEEKA